MFGRLLGLYTIYTFGGLLPSNGILLGAKFTLRLSLAFPLLAALLHSTRAVGMSQALRRTWWGRHLDLYSAGRPSRWASAHILVSFFFLAYSRWSQAWCEFRMQIWNLLHAACWNYETQNSPSAHHRRTLSGYIFATKACIDNRKNVLNNNISTCPHNMLNFGPLTAEIGWLVWDTSANFNGFRVLGLLLHRRRSTEINQTLHDVWPSPTLVQLVAYTI